MTDRWNFLQDMLDARMAAESDLIREMLGRWVSELEPVVLRDENLLIAGLTIAGISIGQLAPVVVANPHYRPRKHWDPAEHFADLRRRDSEIEDDRYPAQ